MIGVGLVLAIYNTHINTMYVMNINCNLFLIDFVIERQNPVFYNKHQNRVFLKDYRTLSLLWTTK